MRRRRQGGAVVTRIWYEQHKGERVTKTEDLEVPKLAKELLAKAEP
jgi:hypothetical protein